MKKSIIIGAVFGALIVPLSSLGLIFVWAEVLFIPFTLFTKWLLLLFFFDTSQVNAMVVMSLFVLINIVWYAFFGYILGLIYQKTSKWVVISIIIIYYCMFAFFGISSVNYVTEKNIDDKQSDITSFTECVNAGFPVMESYPRQCRANNGLFVEEIGNELQQTNLIQLDYPRPNQMVSSPLRITGRARGYWFFEGSFPVVLTDWDGLIIAQGIATAQAEWMTEDFVPFTATLNFAQPTYKNNGSLILQKDNPSGLPENDDALEVPIFFETEKN